MREPKVRRPHPSARRRNRGNKKGAKDEPFVLAESPFQGIPYEELREAFLNIARQAADELPVQLAFLDALLRRVYPHHILSVFAAYGLSVGVTSEGVASKAILSGIGQHHIELLQALALRIPLNEWGQEPVSNSDFAAAKDAIVEVAQAFHQRRAPKSAEAEDDSDKAQVMLVEAIRMHTQMVRNWGYFSDVLRISHELYEPLDERLKAHHGFSATELFTVARAAIALVEDRANERMKMLRKALRGDTPQRVVRQYFAHSPDVEGDPEELIASMPPGVTRDQARARMLAHADMHLCRRMIVTADDIEHITQLSKECCKSALEFISIEPGDLASTDPEHLFLDNPVWTAPLIKIEDRYLCVVPQTMFSFVHDLVRKMAKDAGIEEALAKRRASYLEGRLGSLLGAALPDAKIWSNTEWFIGTDRYETDCVAKLDRTIVIAEAKSAALSSLGLRGHPNRLKRHVNELIQEPALQSTRLEGLIWAAKGGGSDARKSLAPYGSEIWDADQVVRLSVTLDDFSVISPMEGLLKRAGWINSGLDLPATINLADFECAIDILDSPIRFVHYFLERSRFQRALEIVADELDFLGFYLRTGFNVWGIEERKARLSLTGASAPLDKYYQSRDAGVVVPKPSPKVAPYFKKLLWGIEQRKRPGWLTMAIDLLHGLAYEEQLQLERMLNDLRSSVARKWRDPDHQCSVMVTPSPIRDTALVFYVFPPQLNDQRHKVMDVLINKTLEESGRSRCVIVARCTDAWDDPYRFYGFGTPGEDTN